jgi:hypothetical protein
MSSNIDPYIPRNPGDLWTAEDWNDVQKRVKQDISDQVKEAVDNKKTIEHADNADKLENQSVDELTQAILEKVRQDLPQRTGYRQLFKRLVPGQENIVEHNLGRCPVVDLYALIPFRAVCSEDDQKSLMEHTYFYLYQDEEKKIRYKQEDGKTVSVEIERLDGKNFRLKFEDLLTLYKVKYDDRTSLDDLESDFWQALFSDPNDDFDDDDYCKSPWFDRCCGERRTVGQLRSTGEWDNLYLKVIPVKSVNSPDEAVPPSVMVAQYDFNTLGLMYGDKQSDQGRKPGGGGGAIQPAGDVKDTTDTPGVERRDLRVMVLLKV